MIRVAGEPCANSQVELKLERAASCQLCFGAMPAVCGDGWTDRCETSTQAHSARIFIARLTCHPSAQCRNPNVHSCVL